MRNSFHDFLFSKGYFVGEGEAEQSLYYHHKREGEKAGAMPRRDGPTALPPGQKQHRRREQRDRKSGIDAAKQRLPARGPRQRDDRGGDNECAQHGPARCRRHWFDWRAR